MKWLLVCLALAAAGCSQRKDEVSVEVETARKEVGPVAATRSVETTVEVDETKAAAVREEIREGAQ